MRQQLCTLILILVVFPVMIYAAQRIDTSRASVKDDCTTLLLNFDSDITPAKFTQTPSGRFGRGAILPKGGIDLTSIRKNILNVNCGTIEMWIKAPNIEWFKNDHNLLDSNVGWNKPGNIRLWNWNYHDGESELRFDHHSLANKSDAFLTYPMPQDDKWHHVAASWDYRRGMSLYIDGKRVAYKDVTWGPVTLPEEKCAALLCSDNSDIQPVMDEIRLSNAMRFGPDEAAIVHKVQQDNTRVVNGKTILPVSVELYNKDVNNHEMVGKLFVRDYYQRILTTVMLDENLPAGMHKTVSLDVPTDAAGKYIIVCADIQEGRGNSSFRVFDEKFIFPDVLTGPRMQLSLNGTWDVCNGVPMQFIPPMNTTWTQTTLPRRDKTWGTDHTKWFRKNILLPGSMRGKKIELQLNGVRFHVVAFMNGIRVGEGHTDRVPFNVDLTKAANPGKKNELLIAVTDWVSSIRPECQKDFLNVATDHEGNGVGGQLLIRPSTGELSPAGIMDPIFISATNPLRIENAFVTPSVRNGCIKIRTIVDNPANQLEKTQLKYGIFDKDAIAIDGGEQNVTLQPGRNEIIYTINVPKDKLQLWWPKKPYLYRLRVDLKQKDNLVDRFDARFGYREFWCDGPVFRINGVPCKPGVAAGWPSDFYNYVCDTNCWYDARRYLHSFFDINVILVRYHTEPFPIMLFDLADEEGLMVVSEAIMSTLPLKQRFADPRFWEACKQFYPKWVEREWNHPCLVIRSIENEGGYLLPVDKPHPAVGSAAEVKKVTKEFHNIGRMVKRVDPSRPIMYEGSGPVFYDVADIYNVHYPGIPGEWKMFPLTTRWVSFPSKSYSVKEWTWDRRKPLYVGEAYYLVTSTPAALAGLLGDEIYVEDWTLKATREVWRQGVEGHRINGVTAMYCWHPLYPHIWPVLDPEKSEYLRIYKEAISPIVTFIHQLRPCYFAKQNIVRTLTTLNDTLETQIITVKWQLKTVEGSMVDKGEFTVTLPPAGMKRTNVSLALPAVEKSTLMYFEVSTETNGKQQFVDSQIVEVFPDTIPKLKLKSRYGVVDLDEKVFEKLGIDVKKIESNLNSLDTIDVLLISGKITGLPSQKLTKFIRKGGRVVIFETDINPDYLPVALEAVPGTAKIKFPDDANPAEYHTIDSLGSATTMAFPRRKTHPILSGIDKRHLHHWRDNYLLTDYVYKKPTKFSAKAIIDCGEAQSESVLIEVPFAKGDIIAVQLPLLECFSDQPAAQIILANLLKYTDQYQGVYPKPIGIVADADGGVFRFLKNIGANPWPLKGKLSSLNLSAYDAIIVECSAENLKELIAVKEHIKQFVENGGVVWLYGPKPEHQLLLNKLLPVSINLRPCVLTKPVKVLNGNLSTGITPDSLFWRKDGWYGDSNPPSSRILDYVADIGKNKSVEILLDPAALVAINSHRGQWLLDTIKWDIECTERPKAEAYVREILANIGQQLRQPTEEIQRPELGFHTIPIARTCNAGFVGGIWNSPEAGLHQLPSGKQWFGGVEYDILSPHENNGKSCIAFYSATHNQGGIKKCMFRFDCKAAQIHLLITSLWSTQLAFGDKIFDVKINYADGTDAESSVQYGRDIQDWCRPERSKSDYHPAMVWKGPESPYPGLYDFAWNNPHPNKEIRNITLISNNNMAVVVLVAITVQERLPDDKEAEYITPGLIR